MPMLTYDSDQVVREGDVLRSMRGRALYLILGCRWVLEAGTNQLWRYDGRRDKWYRRHRLHCVRISEEELAEELAEGAEEHPLYWHRRS